MNAEIEEHIRKNIPWSHLPSHVKQLLESNSKNYDKLVVSFSVKNQLRFRGNLVRHILKDEQKYYDRIVSFSRDRLMLFPYHLADMIVKGLRITPFNYYVSVVERLMQTEKSYDMLPNFTAADCLRLLGIGRNEYIELMNKSRSNKARLFGKRNVKGLLPVVPCSILIEPWWRVEAGLILEDDIKMVNEEELKVIDKLIDFGSQTAGDLNYHVVLSLYKKGLIYLDVPVTALDRVQVPPLQGFVMNRILGDYFETLLYKTFVSIDEHITVGELANVLDVETELVKQAVSLYCRLHFAVKLDTETEQTRARRHLSWKSQPQPNVQNVDITPLTLNLKCDDVNNLEVGNEVQSPNIEIPDSPVSSSVAKCGKRIAFLFDSTLTAFLMMGNLSPGLKKHAVTMFEVGKLCDESLDSFLTELQKVSVLDAEGEGEARRYFEHAVLLRATVLSLRKLEGAGLDLIRMESLHSLDEATCQRLLQKKYKMIVSMAPLSREVRPICSLAPPHLGPAVPEVNSLWFKLFLYHMTGYGPPTLFLIKGTVLKQLPRLFLGFSKLLVTTWLHEPTIIPIENILHVNAALQYAPILIQGYGVHQAAQVHVISFPFKANTAKVKSGENLEKLGLLKHPVTNILSEFIDIETNCGYIMFAKIGVIDFGNNYRDPIVRLRKNLKLQHNPGNIKNLSYNNKTQCHQDVLTSIINDNFTFEHCKTSKQNQVQKVVNDTKSIAPEEQEKLLQSPIESHFALTPIMGSETSSPANGFTSQDCTKLLNEELDRLERDTLKMKISVENKPTELGIQIVMHEDTLLSPNEDSINMFTIDKHDRDEIRSSGGNYEDNKGEAWTLLDCNFGVPLFDVDANTKICDSIVSGGLAEESSLEKLVESSRKLGTSLLEFISQCQYYPGENMGIIKRGRLTPLPRYNLTFDSGRISEWSGK